MSKFRLIVAISFVLFFASSAYAADIAVDADCSLADAIIAANNDRAEGDCPAGRGADTIILSQDITLDGSLPKITSNITIEGNGYIISGDHRYRIFYNDGGALTINDLTMTKGDVEGDVIRDEDGTLKATTATAGAIVNWKGTLTISSSSFSGNSALQGGAITNFGELSIVNSAFSDNSATSGGAITNLGELSISSSTFSHHSAGWFGGAIDNGYGGELSISNSTFSHNSAELGGAIINAEYGMLSIVNSAFSHNSADEDGGAVYNWGELSISDSSFSSNSADEAGGAIANEGELSIGGSAFSNNSADISGGAVYSWEELSISDSTFSDNEAGAIVNEGELSITNSAFSDNSAELGGAIINAEYGTLSIVNSAFSGNSANSVGGAIVNGQDGTLSIVNGTFSDNSADVGASGAIANAGELSMVNSIIAGRGENACYSDSRLRHNINNFIQDGSCSPAFSGDPMLGELVEPEDGSPAYFPLLAGSPAIDAADDAYCPETDQIGTARPQGAACDIGAIEYVAP